MTKLLLLDLARVGSPALMQAAGLTLLHSLWQGALVALLAAGLLLALHRRAAHLRYQVAASALLAFVGLTAFTFGHYYFGAAVPAAARALGASLGEAVPAGGLASSLPAQQSVFSQPGQATLVGNVLARGAAYVDQHLPLLLWSWLLGMLGMGLRFVAGLSYVQRLKRYRVDQLPAQWQRRVDELARRAGLRQPVRVLASNLIFSPLVVGHFKPLILVPVGALTGLAAAELEVLLIHEIAHVVRKDYLINLLQSVAEIIFFYHPAVWFLSATLRMERENCCDDIAAQLSGDSILLARALSALAEWAYAARTPQLALAASGFQGSLLGRVQRLVRGRLTAPSPLESFGVLSVVAGSAGVIIASTIVSIGAAKPAVMPAVPAAVIRGTTILPQQPALGHAPGKPQAAFESQLLRDGLLADRERYAYSLTTLAFQVNGQAQPARVAERYRALYAAVMGRALSPASPYQVTKNTMRTTSTTAAPSVHAPLAPSRVAASGPASALPAPKVSTTSTTTTVVTPTAPSSVAPAATPPAAPLLPAAAKQELPTPPTPNTQEVTQALRHDGLLAPDTQAFELVLDQAGLRVDGQSQPAALTQKYRELLHVPFYPNSQQQVAIKILVTD